MNNQADRGGCYPPIVYWGNIPSYRQNIACIFQISSTPAGYQELAEEPSENGEIVITLSVMRLINEFFLHNFQMTIYFLFEPQERARAVLECVDVIYRFSQG